MKKEVKPLSAEEFKELVWIASKGQHIWVQLLETENFVAAITDYRDDLGAVAVWCAGSEEDFLRMEDYGTAWVAYTTKPADADEEDKPYPHLNGME